MGVFSSTRRPFIASLNLCKASGLCNSGFCVARSLSSISCAVMGGESLPVVGRILGHTQAQTTARYAHLADDPLQKASERIASSLNLSQMF